MRRNRNGWMQFPEGQGLKMVYLHIVLFLAFQIVAHTLFKWGSLVSQNYWWGFILGNLLGITSIIFMIGMYKSLPAASAIAIGMGGTFVLNQLFMFLIFHEKINLVALLGMFMIFTGILAVSFSNIIQHEIVK